MVKGSSPSHHVPNDHGGGGLTNKGTREPVPTSAGPVRAPARLAWAVFIVVLTIYLLTTTFGGKTSSDVYRTSLQAWALGTSGAPWLEATGDPAAVSLIDTNQYGDHSLTIGALGGWLFAAPFYTVLGDPNTFSLAPGGVAAATLSALGVLWMFLALHRFVPLSAALSATAVYAFGMPTWSVSADGLWTHTLTQTALAGAALAASRSQLTLMGLAIGFGAFGRAHLLVIGLAAGIGLAWGRRSCRPSFKSGWDPRSVRRCLWASTPWYTALPRSPGEEPTR